MQDKIEQSIKVLNEQIASSGINEENKRHLYEIIKGILTSLNNRVYSVKEETHTSYITLKQNPENQNSLLEVCIVDKTVYSSSKSTSKITFPTIIELSNYIDSNLEEITNSLTNISYFSTIKKDLDEEKKIAEAFANKEPKITDTIKELMDSQNHPDDIKEYINKVLQSLNEEHQLLALKDESFEEYLTIQDNSIIIVRKIYNLTNQVVGESSYVILPDEFSSYIVEHQTTIEETLNQTKHF